MIYTQPNVTSSTAGTPVAFAASRTPANWVYVVALSSNGGGIYVGGVDPTTKKAAVSFTGKKGVLLTAGQGFLFPGISAVPYQDLSNLFLDIDPAHSGDGVSVIYAVR